MQPAYTVRQSLYEEPERPFAVDATFGQHFLVVYVGEPRGKGEERKATNEGDLLT